jgi:phosphatidylglycerophosphate synthase/putative flippase GtrA
MTSELKITVLIALMIVSLAVVYTVRIAIKGRVHFDRIERQGGSRFLSKGAMEFGYWILQPVARLLVLAGITPNNLSWASLMSGFLAGGYLALGYFGFAAICATISGLLDSLDGMVARMVGLASDAGEVLDAAVDRYVEFFFISGLIIYYREVPVLQLLALLALLGSFMISYSTAKSEALNIDAPRGSMRRTERAVYLTLGAALSAITIPVFETHQALATPLVYPMVLALGLVALVANVSAAARFSSIARALRNRENHVATPRTHTLEKVAVEEQQPRAQRPPDPGTLSPRQRRSRPSLLVSLRRSQLASLTATLVDFGTLIILVEIGRIGYVAATAIGAFLGALVNFLLGRHWSFAANHESLRGQAIRYALVSAISLILNSLGVYLLTDYAGLHYTASKVITSVSVSLLFNFPLQRLFVFRRRKYA